MPSYDLRSKESNEVSDDLDEGGIVSARIAAIKHTPGSALLSCGSNVASSDPPMSSTQQTFQGRFGVPYDGTEGSVEPTPAPLASTPSVTHMVHPDCYLSGTQSSNDEVDDTGGNGSRCIVGGGVVDFPEVSLMTPQVLGEEVEEGPEDEDIGAADWLDVTHALLDIGPD